MDHLEIEDLRWHDLRHTYASRLAMNGASVVEIKEKLGHKAVQTTMRYSHLSKDYLRGTENRLSQTSDAIDDAVTQI